MPRAARLEGYPRRHRFNQRGAFGPVLRGTRKVRGRTCVLHLLPASTPASRFGVALTRRTLPLAVARNRVKRLAREVFRHHAARDAGLEIVMMLRSKIAEGEEPAFREELAALLDQAVSRTRTA